MSESESNRLATMIHCPACGEQLTIVRCTAAPAPAAIDAAELKRRLRLLAARAARGPNGGLLCRYCGIESCNPPNLRLHLARRHKPQIENEPARAFELP